MRSRIQLLFGRVLVASALASGLFSAPGSARETGARSPGIRESGLRPAVYPDVGTAAPPSDLTGRPTGAQLTGEAHVVDGDTIQIGSIRIRLEGIDAPEFSQTCGRRWLGQWACGTAATAALEGLVRGKQTSCNPTGTDKYGRTLAICFVDGHDVNAEMVRTGYAWAFVKYTSRYVKEEAEARAIKAGIWQGPATPAWYYRQQQWNTAEQEAPKGCAIKGNNGRTGLVYHMPWSPWYGKVKMDGSGTKRWFCSEAEAIAAGYRSAGFR